MTSTAFAFLNGRTQLEADTTAPRGRRRPLSEARRRLAARRFAAAQREYQRRDDTDAYLDRSGLASVDLVDALTKQVQR